VAVVGVPRWQTYCGGTARGKVGGSIDRGAACVRETPEERRDRAMFTSALIQSIPVAEVDENALFDNLITLIIVIAIVAIVVMVIRWLLAKF
jgi:hypothetical protein